MPYKDIYVRHDGGVASIHLNRPAVKNTFTLEMWDDLASIVEASDRDTAVKVIVLVGDGEDFSHGSESAVIERIFSNPEFASDLADALYLSQRRVATSVKPIIAKIRGLCVGTGFDLAMCCDLRFADSSARFANQRVKYGVPLGVEEAKRLVDVVGLSRAADLLYSGRFLGAAEAAAWGLVNELVAPEDLDNAVAGCAAQIAEGSQYAIRATKHILGRLAAGAVEDDADTRRLVVDSYSGADFREGMRAYAEKRKPLFPVA